MFFDENGILNIDEMVVNHPSFRKMMEDGIITDEELQAQTAKVIDLLHHMEDSYSHEQLEEIKNLLAEASVMYAAYHINSLQNLK